MQVKNIWGTKHQENFFRKKITLSQKPETAFARIYCDTGYELFINDRLVAYVDEWCNIRDYVVGIYLKEGENIIAIHGINHGGHRALAFELSVDGETVCVSDDSWVFSETEKWGWLQADYNDSDWKKALVLNTSAAGAPQWRTKPGSEVERRFYPQNGSMFFSGGVAKGIDSPFYSAKETEYIPNSTVAELLGKDYTDYVAEKDLPPAIEAASVLSCSLEEMDKDVLIEKTQRYAGETFIVDMGREVMGFFRMKIKSEDAVSFRLYFGETIDDTRLEMPVDNCQYKMLNEEWRVTGGEQEFESRTKAAFRFVRVEIFNAKAPVLVNGFSSRTVLYPVKKRGWFNCSDDRLNKLWQMSARTVHFCMQEYYYDAPRRDRFLWTGDLRLEGLFNFWLFADTRLLKFSLECLESVQFENGAIPASYGEGCSLLWDYVALYVLTYDDYYKFTGNKEFILKHINSIEAATNYLMSLADENGVINVPENPLGNLWMVVLYNISGYDPVLNDLYLRSLTATGNFAKMAGHTKAAEKYMEAAEKIRPQVEKDREERVVENRFKETSHVTVLHDVTERYIERNDIPGMLRKLEEHWGVMVDSHSDCVHEGAYHNGKPPIIVDEVCGDVWLPFSYCHGWSASAAALLPMGIAGIKSFTHGFKTVEIKPYTDFGEFKCAVPTPYGEIATKLENGVFSWFVPQEIEVKVIIGENVVNSNKGEFVL